MKREAALIPLSRQHHKILVLAQVLRVDVPTYKGMPHLLPDKINFLKEEWENRLLPLLQFEEQKLIPSIKEKNTGAESMVEGLVSFHNQLYNSYEKYIKNQDIDNGVLDLVGHELIAWVRFKERQLFQWMQLELTVDELELLGNVFVELFEKKL